MMVRRALYFLACVATVSGFSTTGVVAPRKASIVPTVNIAAPLTTQKQQIGLSVRSSTTATTTKTSLSAVSESDESSGLTINPIPTAAWFLLVSYAVFVAPGDLLDTSATSDLIEKIIANPLHPEGLNELYYTVFNLFTPMPIILASLALPQANPKDNPTPFLFATSFLGYFTAGPYFATRGPTRTEATKSELGFFTRNLFENRLFGIFTLLLTCASIKGGNAFEAISMYGWETTFQGFIDLVSTNKFCNVSLVDLAMLHGIITLLIPSDYALRTTGDDDDMNKGKAIAAATFFLPFVGSAAYMATRPSLPEE